MQKIKKLDLHRVRHEDARAKVIRFIEHNWGKDVEVEFITGNSWRMRGIVLNVLDEYGLTYQISRMFDLNNKGYIVAWVD
jgi:hypothetical protein